MRWLANPCGGCGNFYDNFGAHVNILFLVESECFRAQQNGHIGLLQSCGLLNLE